MNLLRVLLTLLVLLPAALPAVAADPASARAELMQRGLAVTVDGWFAAVAHRDATALGLYAAAGQDPDARSRSTGATALVYAAANGDLPAVQAILGAGADVNAQERVSGRTALWYAAEGGFEPVVRALMERGAKVDLRDGIFEEAPIDAARRTGHIEVVRILHDGMAAATAPPSVAIAATVVTPERGAQIADTRERSAGDDLEILPPLQVWSPPATRYSLAEQVQMGTLFDAVRSHDSAALRVALDSGYPIELRNEYGFSVLTVAAYLGDPACAAVLLEHGADINARDRAGFTPLMHASMRGHMALVDLLVSRGADVNARSMDSSTPLHLASTMNQIPVVERLLRLGALPDVRTFDRRFPRCTPLMIAAGKGFDAVVGYLLDGGANPNLRSASGWTALKFAEMNSRRVSAELIRMVGGTM